MLAKMIAAGESPRDIAEATGCTEELVRILQRDQRQAADIERTAAQLHERYGLDLIKGMEEDPLGTIIQSNLMTLLLADDEKTRFDCLKLLARIVPDKFREAAQQLAAQKKEKKDDDADWVRDGESDMARLGLN